MTFNELLKEKDAAIEDDEAAKRGLEGAELARVTAQEWADKAAERVLNAHAAITAYLAEKGHAFNQAPDGTVTVYHTTDKVPEGWAAYQPVPGDAA